jgi:hypothetical protein
MATVSINGMIYHGSDITISQGRVTVDGKDVTPEAKNITIAVDGNIDTLKADQCSKIVVNGSCGSLDTMSGDVDCGPVNGPVKTMSGDVKCGHVGKSVETMSGDVDCSVVGGSVTTNSGDIDHRTIGDDKAFTSFIVAQAPHLIEEFQKASKEHV